MNIAILNYYGKSDRGVEVWARELAAHSQTATFNICKGLSKYHNVTLIFDKCDQMERFINLPCRILKIDKEMSYKFDTLILMSCWGYIPLNIKSDKTIQVVHADFDYFVGTTYYETLIKNLKNQNTFVAVSEQIKKSFLKHVGKTNIQVIHNLIC